MMRTTGLPSRLREIEQDIRRRVSPASSGEISLRIEAIEEEGRPVALVHVAGCTDCRGTEAEIAGLLRGHPVDWRIVWH
jgi:hypothetical protein